MRRHIAAIALAVAAAAGAGPAVAACASPAYAAVTASANWHAVPATHYIGAGTARHALPHLS